MSGSDDDLRLGRYVRLGLLGRGGTADVHRVWDPVLRRSVAMKVSRWREDDLEEAIARFRDEAQATAQLQHPGVVAVHELGALEGGQIYFTMKEIRGRTLDEIVAEVHGAPPDAPTPFTFRRLLDAMHQVCQAVAYAHSRGVMHRDIKPTNIMVGEYGEVLVLDWGLAKVFQVKRASQRMFMDERDADVYSTMDGAVMGTPMYMSPEQAGASAEELGPRSDVYSLGAVLFHVLSGRAPFKHRSLGDLLTRVMAGLVEPLQGRFPIPAELEELCLQAMSRDPQARPADAGELASRLSRWLEGESGRARATALLKEADEALPRIRATREEAARLKASASLGAPGFGSTLEERRRAWAVEDRADAMLRDANLEMVRVVQTLHSALEHAELPEVRARLADHYRAEAEAAEERRDEPALSAALTQLTAYDRGRYRAWIQGMGAISLRTDPPAHVSLSRYELQDRRLVPVFERELGPTPLVEVPVPAGSYRLTLRAEGCPELVYPVRVRRGATWEGSGAAGDRVVPLPRALGPGEIAVLAGPYLAGGDAVAPHALPREEPWVEGFVIQRHVVSNADYLAFINDLAMSGQATLATHLSPRLSAGPASPYPWRPDLPLHRVDIECAEAYAAWLSRRTGRAWRLPTEREWEKAARGVDGRAFPWGDFLDPAFCAMADTPRASQGPDPLGALGLDESPYGGLGFAGNLHEWCADPWSGEGAHPDMRAVRGGSWQDAGPSCRCAARTGQDARLRDDRTGFRLAYSFI